MTIAKAGRIHGTIRVLAFLGWALALTQEIGASPRQVFFWGSGEPAPPPPLTNILSVAPNFALTTDHTVLVWGNNAFGQNNVPDGLNDVMAIGRGGFHRLALRANGKVVAWGGGATNTGIHPHHGQSIVPAGLTNVIAIAAGSRHSAALKSDGRVVAWGFNFYGQTNVPTNLTNAIAIASGADADYTLALKADGTVIAWGYHFTGVTNIPAGLTNVIAIAAGRHALALKADGTIVAWGGNDFGQTDIPPAATNVIAIAAGRDHSMALRADGAVIIWGDSHLGQTNVPFGLTNVLTIAASGFQSFVINDGAPVITQLPLSGLVLYSGRAFSLSVSAGGFPVLAYQWWFNGVELPGATNAYLFFSSLQTNHTGSYSVVVSNSSGAVASPAVTLSVSNSTPFIDTQPVGQTVARGYAQLLLSVQARGSSPQTLQWRLNGTNIPGENWNTLVFTNIDFTAAGDYSVVVSNEFGGVVSDVATLVVLPTSIVAWGGTYVQRNIPALTNVLAVAAGSYHSLALNHDGRVFSWGGDLFGPTNVSGLSNVIAIAAGAAHSLALRDDGTVVAWGENFANQTNVPANLTNVVAISAGSSHSLALKSDGTVTAWGSYEVTNLPPGLSNVVAIAASIFHSLALRSDGSVVAWGSGYGGEADVVATNIIAVTTAFRMSCGLQEDGTVIAWGSSYLNYYSIFPPVGLSDVIAVSAGADYFGDHSMALRRDGTVVCWGSNDYGQTNVPPDLVRAKAIAAGRFFSLAVASPDLPVVHAELTQPKLSADGFSVSIPTQSGRVYRLEYKDSLQNTYWTPMPLVAGTGGMVTLNDSTPSSAQRFYQVRRW